MTTPQNTIIMNRMRIALLPDLGRYARAAPGVSAVARLADGRGRAEGPREFGAHALRGHRRAPAVGAAGAGPQGFAR